MPCKKKRSSGFQFKSLVCCVFVAGSVSAWAEPSVASSPVSGRVEVFGLGLKSPYLLAANTADGTKASSRDALFDDDDPFQISNEKTTSSESHSGSGIKGFVQFNVARDYEKPAHWSQVMTRVGLGLQGDLGDGIKWKLGARLDYDAVYDVTNYYSSSVRDEQGLNLFLMENYLDVSSGDWDFRLGKQHIVWGEMVGLFFADVVSARNMYEFILPSFDVMRIPQWAARAEYFKDDFHAELIWIPVASYDLVGVPGSEFFPFVPPVAPGFSTEFRNEDLPSRSLSNTNYGVRLSTLKNGWDVSGFAYSSMDIQPTFYRQVMTSPQPTMVYQAKHDRIDQFGGTLSKDFDSLVFRMEAVYTHGRKYYVSDPGDADGVVPKNVLDWAVGLDFPFTSDTRLNVQFFQRDFFDYNPSLISDKHESGYSLYGTHKFGDKLEAQVTWISSLNRTDWLFRPRLVWNIEKNWVAAAGVDVFKGPPLGAFGRFDANDRVYSEVRYSF